MNPKSNGLAPALTLLFLSPLLAEVLPGATRFSSLFVLPVEICVWGGGALMIRYIVRRWSLGWKNMLLLALGLAVAEECLIQQTSLAPMVLQIKGQVFARAFGINYVYMLWALVYESIFVVFLPVYLVELIFPARRKNLWLNRTGFIVMIVFFIIGSFMAWYSWTQIARPKVFKVPLYDPPVMAIITAILIICCLVFAALGPFKKRLVNGSDFLTPPSPWIIGLSGAVWAVLWYGLVLLAFGIAPSFPSWIAILGGFLLIAVILILVPRWTSNPEWNPRHNFALISGTVMGSMLAGFMGFIGAMNMDLYFKIIVNAIAIILLIYLGFKVKSDSVFNENYNIKKPAEA